MTIHIDEKGKRFTTIIPKDRLQAVIQTVHNRIDGNVYVCKGERLKDELNKQDQFIAVSEAIVYNQAGEIVHKTHFLALNRDLVLWIMPVEEMIRDEQPGGGAL